MSYKNDHWAWTIPNEEFHPLGNRKYYYLLGFMHKINWQDFSDGCTLDGMIELINDRKIASKIYTVYKAEIEQYILDREADDLKTVIKEVERKNKKLLKQIAKREKEKKMNIEKIDNVISFEEFKNRKAS